jgi:hypothetical protein
MTMGHLSSLGLILLAGTVLLSQGAAFEQGKVGGRTVVEVSPVRIHDQVPRIDAVSPSTLTL